MKHLRIGIVFALLLALAGCTATPVQENNPGSVKEEETLTFRTSFYPLFALTLPIVENAENVRLRNLTQPLDTCPRAYTLSVWDAAILSDTDLLILGGRGLETFSDLSAPSLATFAAMDACTLIRDGETASDGDDEASHFLYENPWLWLSVDGAREMSRAIASALMTADPVNSDTYAKNLQAWERTLDALDEARASALDACAGAAVGLLHEGLEYIARDLALDARVTIRREPTEELDAEALASAIAQLREQGVRVLLIEEQAPQRTRDDLTQAGFVVVKIDTLMAHTESDVNIYPDTMRDTYRAIVAVCAPRADDA